MADQSRPVALTDDDVSNLITAACRASIICEAAHTVDGDGLPAYVLRFTDSYHDVMGEASTHAHLFGLATTLSGLLAMEGYDASAIRSGNLPDVDTGREEENREEENRDASTNGQAGESAPANPARESAGDSAHAEAPRLNVVGQMDPAQLQQTSGVTADDSGDAYEDRPDPNANPNAAPETRRMVERMTLDHRGWCKQHPLRAAIYQAVLYYGQHEKIIVVPLLHKYNDLDFTGWDSKELLHGLEDAGIATITQSYEMSEREGESIAVLEFDESNEAVQTARRIVGKHVDRTRYTPKNRLPE